MRVIKCIVGNGNYTLKMADTDNFPEIIDDNRKRTRPLHKLYILATKLPGYHAVIACPKHATNNTVASAIFQVTFQVFFTIVEHSIVMHVRLVTIYAVTSIIILIF